MSIFVEEVLAQHRPLLSPTTLVSSCGAASVGRALGQMIHTDRFTKPTVVLLDADQDPSDGCHILPGGGQPPERFVFQKVLDANFGTVPEMLKRDYASVSEAIKSAMAIKNHHNWLAHVANKLRIPAEVVWRAMAAEWASTIATQEELDAVLRPIEEAYLTLNENLK